MISLQLLNVSVCKGGAVLWWELKTFLFMLSQVRYLKLDTEYAKLFKKTLCKDTFPLTVPHVCY